jgi:hypothetical protein
MPPLSKKQRILFREVDKQDFCSEPLEVWL